MKYVVIVNNKFIVNGIESTSAGGAEHKILDNYNGIAGAQAFALNELGTDCFAGFCESCEMISLSELKEMTDKYDELWTAVAEAKDYADSCDRLIGVAKVRLLVANDRLEEAKKQVEDATCAAKSWQERMGIPRSE